MLLRLQNFQVEIDLLTYDFFAFYKFIFLKLNILIIDLLLVNAQNENWICLNKLNEKFYKNLIIYFIRQLN